ncbi:UDP-glucose 4-epimerase-like [Symsagittifera roscoffensis]|uniref:UDP-glucose 4-epimerase-like n=1 Tax=Symsagittifera roscoffensis TaxID=84072 RepID=UPI00307BB92D
MSSRIANGTRVVNGEGRGGGDFGEGTCILVTGGAGFIGSIVTLELLVKGLQVVVVDNCSNSYIAKGAEKPESLIRVEKLANGKTGKKKEVTFYLMDILEKDKLLTIFQEHNFFCVMHLAGLKSVGESVKYPLKYYEVNMGIATNLLRCMDQTGVTNFVFASSSTVYGPVPCEQLPITEEQPTGNCTCAYGRTKYFIEEMLKDCCRANPAAYDIVYGPVPCEQLPITEEQPTGNCTCAYGRTKYFIEEMLKDCCRANPVSRV